MRPRIRRKNRGSSDRLAFSIVELLVVICIVAVLLSILIPYVTKIRETDHRAQCAENLRELMAALHSYSAANKGAFPRVEFDAARGARGYVAYTGADSSSPFSKGTKVRPNDVTASLWLLVRAKLVRPAAFVCPSTWATADPAAPSQWKHRSNFTGGRFLSYSYACPFSDAPGYRLDDFLPADFALMADRNPGVSAAGSDVTGPSWDAPPLQLARANSNNHARAGQNVLYADGHVAFQTTPYCGVGNQGMRDNIYTALSAAPLHKGISPPVQSPGVVGRNVGPAWPHDSYLVPTDQD